MKSPPLEHLVEIGKVAAENDFRPEFFVSSTSWSNVRNQTKPIVVGRKGSGKTAIRYSLATESRTNPTMLVADLTFRDYPWKAHNQVFDEDAGSRTKYLETWQFLMLVELAKLAVGKDQGPDVDPLVASGLRRFIEQNWGSVTFDHRDTFRPKELKVQAKGGVDLMKVIKGELQAERVPRERLGNSLIAMNRWLKEALAHVVKPDLEYFLVFDELDLEFVAGDDEYQSSMIGLVLAAQAFHSWAHALDARALAVVLLRDDIYFGLSFPDRNKITQDLVERIQWEPRSAGPNSLKPLVTKRIAVILDTPEPDAWNLAFDPVLMRGKQDKFDYIVQRTYLRPRDLIQFVNLCLAQARDRLGRAPEDSDRITNVDMTAARTPYSKYLRDELENEVSAHYPHWESWLEIIRRVGKLTFARRDFDEECARSTELTAGAEPEVILRALYDFSAIAFARRGGSGRGGTDEYWRYRSPDVPFDPNAPYFRVHWGLKETLDLKEWTA